MGRIPDEIIEQVRERADIVDLVGRYVGLKPAGRTHKGLCPFHQEKTPSFVVTRDRATFKCFGCGEGGNVFGFLMRLENLTFPEAVRALASENGIEVPEAGGSSDGGRRAALFGANEIAQSVYREALQHTGNPGAAYLEARGIGPEAIERFEIGFAPDRWDTVVQALRSEKVAEAIGAEAGLLSERRSGGYFDLLRGRITFPIRDVRGRIIGFGGRSISEEQQPKYLNSPESPVFQKRRSFFGFPAALEPIRREGRSVLVEGYFDLVALESAGIRGGLATCGTALTEDHARELHRRTRKVVLVFDGDAAGQKAMEKSLEVLLPEDLRVHAAVLPEGDDPDTFLAREGAEALRELVEAAPAALDVAIRRAVARGVASPSQKADAVAAIAPLLVRLSNAVERGAFEERLAISVGADVDHVRAAVRAEQRGEDPRDAVPVGPRVEPPEVHKLRRLARSLLDHPHLAARVEPSAVLDRSEHPVIELVRRLIAAAGANRSVDLEEISTDLSEAGRSLLYALAAEDVSLEEAAAERTVADTNRWLRDRATRARQLELTERMRQGDGDPLEILRAKQRAETVDSDSPPEERPN